MIKITIKELLEKKIPFNLVLKEIVISVGFNKQNMMKVYEIKDIIPKLITYTRFVEIVDIEKEYDFNVKIDNDDYVFKHNLSFIDLPKDFIVYHNKIYFNNEILELDDIDITELYTNNIQTYNKMLAKIIFSNKAKETEIVEKTRNALTSIGVFYDDMPKKHKSKKKNKKKNKKRSA